MLLFDDYHFPGDRWADEEAEAKGTEFENGKHKPYLYGFSRNEGVERAFNDDVRTMRAPIAQVKKS